MVIRLMSHFKKHYLHIFKYKILRDFNKKALNFQFKKMFLKWLKLNN